MNLLALERISKAFGDRVLWEAVSADVPHQARIALVGEPSSGVTTLLRVLAGREAPDRGRVQRARNLRVGWPSAAAFRRGEGDLTVRAYCLQTFARLQAQELTLTRLEQQLGDPHRTADLLPKYGSLQEDFETRGGMTYRGQARKVMDGLGFRAVMADLVLGELAAEGRLRARLARVLLEDPDLLILDQPARAMPADTGAWLAGWLREWPGAVVCATPAAAALEADLDTVWHLTTQGVEVLARTPNGSPESLRVPSTSNRGSETGRLDSV
jgi:ATP-binding cassette subfamily F protein 3